jgi:hypothetical protein
LLGSQVVLLILVLTMLAFGLAPGSRSGRVSETDAVASELNRKLDAMSGALNQLSQARSASQPDKIQEELQRVRDSVGQLSESLRKLEADADPKRRGEALAAALAQRLRAEWKDGPRPPADREAERRALKALLQEVLGKELPTRADLDVLARQTQEIGKRLDAALKSAQGPGEQLDVIVLATHSHRLQVNDYLEAYQRLIAGLPRDPGGRYRLGFYVAVTSRLDSKVGLKDGKITERSYQVLASSGNETERLDEIGGKLLDEFDPDRPRQRCVLVASLQCEPPRADADGWKQVKSVDVVLIQRDRQTAEPPALARWLDFCAARQGQVVLLPAADKTKQTEQLYEQLYRLAQPQARR